MPTNTNTNTNIEKQQHIISQTTHYNNSMQSTAVAAAGMPGPIENTSNTNWIKSLRE